VWDLRLATQLTETGDRNLLVRRLFTLEVGLEPESEKLLEAFPFAAA